MDLKQFKWTREPASFEISDDAVYITTAPHTDLWQRTYYHFRNDNAPVLRGVVMYLDSENWIKGSIEYENGEYQHLGSVVTNRGWSDWATTGIPADIKEMWYRLSRREDDYRIECSEDGCHWKQMRICHMHEGAGKVRFGVYACSPEDSSFTAVFSDFQLTECAWLAHDGQQPDQE